MDPPDGHLPMRKTLSLTLPFIGLALFVYIVAKTGPNRIASVFAEANWRMLLLSPLFVCAIILLRGVRWRILMRAVGIEYSLWRSAAVWTIGFFAASVTPAKAGDAIRALYVQTDTGRSFGEAFLTVFIDRLWDLVLVLFLGVVSVLLFSRYYIRLPSFWIVILAALGMGVCVYLAVNRRLMRRLLKPIFDALVPHRYKEMFSLNFHTFYDSLELFGRKRGVMAVAFLLTVLVWGIVFLLAWYLTVVFGIEVRPAYVFLIMPIVTLVELLPISVSGLGTRDATVIYFFSVVGLSSAAAVSFSIGYLLIGTYVTAAPGFALWIRHPVKLGSP
jgi:uncharacterized protein (TIRG00374 family)